MQYKLLILDDENHIAEGIANLFPWERIGFSAIAFSSAELALNYMRDRQVDVLMSDIEMPGLNGLELCQRLQEERLGVRVVFISSHQNYEYLRAAIRYGVEDYILKPIKSDDLLSCFEKIKRDLDVKHSVQEEGARQGYYETIIKEVKEYIEREYQEATLEEAAEQVNLSAAYLSRLLKEKEGSGFQELLLKQRMEKAAELLSDIHYKSYDIAYYVGYDNPKSFSRAFKLYYGMTPKEYRQGKTEGEK